MHISVTFQNLFTISMGAAQLKNSAGEMTPRDFSLPSSLFTLSMAPEVTGVLCLKIGFTLSLTCKEDFVLSSPVNNSLYFCFIYFSIPISKSANFTEWQTELIDLYHKSKNGNRYLPNKSNAGPLRMLAFNYPVLPRKTSQLIIPSILSFEPEVSQRFISI